MDTQVASSRGQGPPSPLGVSRRAEDAVLARATRAAGADPLRRRNAAEPVLRRPALEPATRRPAAEPVLGPRAGAAEPAPPRAPAAPPFEWLDLELVPPGAPPNPRGYAVYSQAPRPVPAPIILIDTAA